MLEVQVDQQVHICIMKLFIKIVQINPLKLKLPSGKILKGDELVPGLRKTTK